MSYTLQELREDVRDLMDGGSSLPLTGGTLTGPLVFDNSFGDTGGNILAYDATGREILLLQGGDSTPLTEARIQLYGAGDSGSPNSQSFYGDEYRFYNIAATRLMELSDDGELMLHETPTIGGQIRLSTGSDVDSVLLRNDGTNFFMLITDTQLGTWNTDRPFYFNLGTGLVGMNQGAQIGTGIYNTSLRYTFGTSTANDYIDFNESTNVFRFIADNSQYTAVVKAHEFIAYYDASNYAQFTSDNTSYLHLYLTGLTNGIAINADINSIGETSLGTDSYPWGDVFVKGPYTKVISGNYRSMRLQDGDNSPVNEDYMMGYVSSSELTKDIANYMSGVEAMAGLRALNPMRYAPKVQPKDETWLWLGFTAEVVEPVFPELISGLGGEQAEKSVHYDLFTVPLAAAAVHLDDRLIDVEKGLTELREKVRAL
jgi:hypothetical protein